MKPPITAVQMDGMFDSLQTHIQFQMVIDHSMLRANRGTDKLTEQRFVLFSSRQPYRLHVEFLAQKTPVSFDILSKGRREST